MNTPSVSDFHHALILGGAASGKSLFAEQLAGQWSGEVCYIATSRRFGNDDEWKKKIDGHRQRRPSHWQTIEEPLHLSETLAQAGTNPQRLLLVDCLTLWLCHLMETEGDLNDHFQRLACVLTSVAAKVILVSNETGLGVVPEHALSRGFRNRQGELNQHIAATVDRVFFIAAGLPLQLK